MSKKNVLETECDQCGTTVQNELPVDVKDTLRIPEGWIQVKADTRLHTIFVRDLCESCKMGILNAAGHSTKSSTKVTRKVEHREGE